MDGDGSHWIINMNKIKEKNGENRNKTSNKSNDVRLPWVDHGTGRWKNDRQSLDTIFNKRLKEGRARG